MADLVMPKFGLTMTEGLLSEWLVEEGARFAKGDVLFSVETEKVTSEVEAEAGGTLSKILISAGETVPVGTAVAQLALDGVASALGGEPANEEAASEEAASSRVEMGASDAAKNETAQTPEQTERVLATPLARKIAKNESVDLHGLPGTGPRGRIQARDVRAAAEERPDVSPQPGPGQAPDAGTTIIAPDAARLATARRVTASKRDIPHFYVTSEVEITALKSLRKELNLDERRARISVTHLLVKALGVALSEMPDLNRIWSEDSIIAFDRVDLGLVAETPDGLRIPVLRDVGRAPLDQIAVTAADLTSRAREGALTQADVGESVISLSNVGMFGVTSMAPIINPPNAMILGVGAERALFRPGANGDPSLRCELTLTLACDHRVIDGADAARFLSRVVDLLQQPLELLRPALTRM